MVKSSMKVKSKFFLYISPYIFRVLSMDFNYQVEIEGNSFEITQRGEKFNMLVNNQQFESLYGGIVLMSMIFLNLVILGGLNGYDDFGRPQESYGYSQSRSGEKYGRKDTFRNNV